MMHYVFVWSKNCKKYTLKPRRFFCSWVLWRQAMLKWETIHDLNYPDNSFDFFLDIFRSFFTQRNQYPKGGSFKKRFFFSSNYCWWATDKYRHYSKSIKHY